MVISSPEDIKKATEFIKDAISATDDIDAKFSSKVTSAHQLHKDLLETVNEFKTPFLSSVEAVKGKLKEYLDANPNALKEVKVKGLSSSVKETVSVPSLNDGQFIEILKLGVKGKLPPGLFKIDPKVYQELYNLGMFNTLGESAKPIVKKVRTVTVRRK